MTGLSRPSRPAGRCRNHLQMTAVALSDVVYGHGVVELVLIPVIFLVENAKSDPLADIRNYPETANPVTGRDWTLDLLRSS